MKKYVILEMIPTSRNPEKGEIIQLSAVKIDDLKLIDRFDYRLEEDKVPFSQFLEIINYDKDLFTYKKSTNEIMKEFKKWVGDYEVLIVDDSYTSKYLTGINNKISSILDKLDLEYHDYIIDEIMEKYHIEPTNYIVDVLYEALIAENNNTKKD